MTIAKPKPPPVKIRIFPGSRAPLRNALLCILVLSSALQLQACWPFGEDAENHQLADSTALAGLFEANNLDYLDPGKFTESDGGGYSVLRAPELELEVVEPYIGRLRRLQNVDLSLNRLRVLSTGFWNLGVLLRMDLSGNLIDSIAPGMSALRQLNDLNLNDNKLTALPPEIASMPRLRTLYLSGNRITGLPADFSRIEDLSVLDLSDNELTSLPASLVIGRNFSMLGVRGNRLCNLPGQVAERLSLYDPDWRETQRCP